MCTALSKDYLKYRELIHNLPLRTNMRVLLFFVLVLKHARFVYEHMNMVAVVIVYWTICSLIKTSQTILFSKNKHVHRHKQYILKNMKRMQTKIDINIIL